MCSKHMLQSNGSPRSAQVGINKRAAAVYSTKAGVVYNSRVRENAFSRRASQFER